MSAIESVHKFKGHFKMVAIKPDGTERVLAEFDNMILDAGLARLASGNSGQGWIHLGTGTAAPAATQTTLVTRVLGFNTNQSNVDSFVAGPPPYSQTVLGYRSEPGVATGTFSEIGLGWNSTGSLFSRALILDGASNPTTVTVLADEYLQVYYTFRHYFPTADVNSNITINGTNYAVLTRHGYWGDISARILLSYGLQASFSGDSVLYGSGGGLVFGAAGVDCSSTGGHASSTGRSSSAVAGNSYARDFVDTFGVSAVPGGNQVLAMRGRYSYFYLDNSYKHQFTPPIPKTSSQVLTLTTRVTLARYP